MFNICITIIALSFLVLKVPKLRVITKFIDENTILGFTDFFFINFNLIRDIIFLRS